MTIDTTPAEESVLRDFLVETLPKAAHKKIDEIVQYFEEVLGQYTSVDEVDIRGARCSVETVTAYGLELDVDAAGNAVAVHFPYGAEVAA